MKKFFAKIIFLIYLLFTNTVFCQHYYFKRYTSWDGLVQNTIRVIKQDELGRIWIGTSEGFSIYDGREFINYTKGNGLGGNVVDDFFQADSNTMWVSTVSNGISIVKKNRLLPDTVVRVIKGKKYFINSTIDKIYRDPQGRVWFCTDGGITEWSNENPDSCRIRHFDKKNEPGHIYVYDVIEDERGNLWFGSNSGLIEYSNNKFSFIKGYSKPIWSVRRFNNDSLWLATDRGILIYRNGKFKKAFKNSLLANTEVNEIYKEAGTNVWIASDNGIFHYNGKTLKDFSVSLGSQTKYIISFLEDRQGSIWIGTADGLLQILSRNLYYINAKYKYSYLWNIIPLSSGKVYATTKDGLYKIENYKLVPAPIGKKLPTKTVTRAIFQKDGTKWFGTNNGLFEIKNGKVKSFTKKDGLNTNYILSLIPGGKDSIWVGTKGYWKPHLGRVYLIVHDKVILLPALKAIPQNEVTTLFRDRSKNLWIGFFTGGLYKLTGTKLTEYNYKEGLTDNNIRYVIQDRDGIIWVMTRYKGIFKYANGRFKNYNINDGLTSNWVLAGVQDKYGTLWFNTAKGVCSFDGKRFKKFYFGGRLMSGEMWASAVDKKGNLWFANSNYIFIYKPHPQAKKYSGDVYIKDVLIDDMKPGISDGNSPLKVNYNNNSVEVSFAEINFKNNKSVRYQYKLTGLRNRWSPPTQRDFVVYNHLPAGSYIFKVRAKFPNGRWSRINSSFSFIIKTPLWQQTWFELLTGLCGIGLIALITSLIYQYRIKQILKIQKIRSRIASDLHDDIGANLSSISIFSELANLEIKKEPRRAAQIMRKVGVMARELVDSLSDKVWVINPETESPEELIKKMKDFAFELLQAKQMELRFWSEAKLPDIKLSMDTRRNLLLIFKETINNTAKHSNASVVEVKFGLMKERSNSGGDVIFLRIKDNGRGFSEADKGMGNGLINLHKRAGEINASISIKSKPGAGTVTELSIPLR